MSPRIPMRRAIGMIAALLMLTGLVPAEAATFGRTTIGTTPSAGLRADFKRGSKFTLTQTGTLKKLCAYLDGKAVVEGGQEHQYFRLVVYRDAGGVPGTRVAEALRDDMLIIENGAAQWHCADTALVPLSPGAYWIVILSGGSQGASDIIRYYYDGTGNWYGNADTMLDGSSYSFGPGSTGNGTMSAYAVFDTPAELGSAGKTTLGATPSGALRAHFKRGSSFTLSEAARVASLSVFLDGLGGTSGFQNVRALLYRDKSGVPDSLVSGGDKFASRGTGEIPAGMSPTWFTWDATQPIDLPPGKYWLILHTDGTPLVRYYFDGAGNWFGNADDFNDGAANPFGIGAAGDGTMSAFVSYKRGPFITQKFGRTDIASQPLAPLSANFFRGGYFQVPGEYKWLTATYAYLDGLGGASGSQKMKMLLNNGYDTVMAATEEVTISAGMPPQWVRFPLNPPVRVQDDRYLGSNSGYYLFLYTGATQGVARTYGDGPNNWHGRESPYPQVPLLFDGGSAPLLQHGTKSLSIYGELSVPRP